MTFAIQADECHSWCHCESVELLETLFPSASIVCLLKLMMKMCRPCLRFRLYGSVDAMQYETRFVRSSYRHTRAGWFVKLGRACVLHPRQAQYADRGPAKLVNASHVNETSHATSVLCSGVLVLLSAGIVDTCE